MKLSLILFFSSLSFAVRHVNEENEIPDEIQSVLSEQTLDYDPESVGLIVDIALTLYEGLMEFSQKNKKAEKVTFKPRIDSIDEDEEQLNYDGENEIENLSNHRNEYHSPYDLNEWKNENIEAEHQEELQELLEEEKEILGNLNNHRNDYDDEYYNFNDSVSVKLSLDTEADDEVQGFIFDLIKQDIVDRWKQEMFDLTNNTDDDVYGFNSDFPNIYTQSEVVFDAIKGDEAGSSNHIDPVAERSLGDDGIILNENLTEKYKEKPKRIVLTEYEGEKFAKEPNQKVLRENQIENSSVEPDTGLKQHKKRRRRRRKPMFDRESGFSPPRRHHTPKGEEIEAELSSFPLKQSRKKLRTKSGRHKRKRFPGKKSVRRSQSKQNAVNRPSHLKTLKLAKYQEEKLSFPKIQLHGRPLRVRSLINRL